MFNLLDDGLESASGSVSGSNPAAGEPAPPSASGTISASADFSTVHISALADAVSGQLFADSFITVNAQRFETIYLPNVPFLTTVKATFDELLENGAMANLGGGQSVPGAQPGQYSIVTRYAFSWNVDFEVATGLDANAIVQPQGSVTVHKESSGTVTLDSIKAVDPILGDVDPGPIFFGSKLGDTPPPASGPIPDIVASSLAWAPDCGLDFNYDIKNAPLPRGTTIAVYWAGGTTLDSVIGDSVEIEPSQTAMGSYSVHLGCTTLGTPPTGATDVIVVVDPPTASEPSGAVAESDDAYGAQSDNTQAVPLLHFATTTTVTSDPFVSTYGQKVTFTATVNVLPPGFGTPSGQVVFLDNGVFLGTGDLDASGVATFTTADDFPAGEHDITAQYVGQGNFDPSDSDTYVQSVERATTQINGVFDYASVYGQELRILPIVVVLTHAPTLPTGELLLFDSSPTPIAQANPFNGTGVDFSRKDLAAGTHTMEVAYSGDDNFKPIEFIWIVSVTKAPLTVTADNKDIAHGDPIPPLTWTFTGFVNADTAAVVGGAPKLSTTATSSSPAGHYPIDITIGSLAADNYAFRFVPGTLTVHPKVIDIQVHYGTQTMSLLHLNRDLPFVNITALDVSFSDNVSAFAGSLMLKSTTPLGHVYGLSGFNYDPLSHDATWTLPGALGIDRLLASLDNSLGAAVDTSIKILGARTWNFAVLPGDYDGDGIVTISDALAIRNQTPGFLAAGTIPSGWADLDGNGIVDLNDINLAKARVGKKLPPP